MLPMFLLKKKKEREKIGQKIKIKKQTAPKIEQASIVMKMGKRTMMMIMMRLDLALSGPQECEWTPINFLKNDIVRGCFDSAMFIHGM